MSEIKDEFTKLYSSFVILTWVWQKYVLKNKDKKRVKSVFPAKLYVNTIKQVFDKFSIPAEYKFKEEEEFIQITVSIPKK